MQVRWSLLAVVLVALSLGGIRYLLIEGQERAGTQGALVAAALLVLFAHRGLRSAYGSASGLGLSLVLAWGASAYFVLESPRRAFVLAVVAVSVLIGSSVGGFLRPLDTWMGARGRRWESRRRDGSKWATWVARGVGLVVLAALAAAFVVGVERRSTANDDLTKSDQGAYLDYARALEVTPGETVLDRNRMPLYPYLVALSSDLDVVDRHVDDRTDASPATERALRTRANQGVFGRAKAVNVVISLVGLGLLLWLASRRLGWRAGVATGTVFAFSVLAYKAPWAQADVLWYFLYAAALLAAAGLLRRPTPLHAVVAGGLVAVAQLAKPSAYLLLALFALYAAVLILVWAIRGERGRAVRLACCVLYLGTAAVVLLPYALNSRAVYGDPLYNVNTKYYAWYDSWEEALDGTGSHGDSLGPPDLPAEQLPTPTRYLHEHGVGAVADRLGTGVAVEARLVTDQPDLRVVVFAVLFTTATIFLSDWSRAVSVLSKGGHAVTFGALAMAVYLAGYAWWMPIAEGLRFPLTVLLPVLLGFGWFITTFLRTRRESGRPLPGWFVVAYSAGWAAVYLFAAVEAALSGDPTLGGT